MLWPEDVTRRYGRWSEAAGFEYADGIGVWCIRCTKSYPQGRSIRVAGADLWEAIVRRASLLKDTQMFWLVVNLVLAQTESRLRQRWQVNIVGSGDGYFTLSNARHCSNAFAAAGENRHRRGGHAARDLRARLPAPVSARAVWASAALTMFLPGTSIGRAKFRQDLGLEWFYRALCSRAVSKTVPSAALFTLALFR